MTASSLRANHNQRSSTPQSGQLLMEVLISSLVLLIITSGIVVSIIISVRNATYARQQTLAMTYAERELERVKDRIKTLWFSDDVCSFSPPAGSYDGISGMTITVSCAGVGTVQCIGPSEPTCLDDVVKINIIAHWQRTSSGAHPMSYMSLTTFVSKY